MKTGSRRRNDVAVTALITWMLQCNWMLFLSCFSDWRMLSGKLSRRCRAWTQQMRGKNMVLAACRLSLIFLNTLWKYCFVLYRQIHKRCLLCSKVLRLRPFGLLISIHVDKDCYGALEWYWQGKTEVLTWYIPVGVSNWSRNKARKYPVDTQHFFSGYAFVYHPVRHTRCMLLTKTVQRIFLALQESNMKITAVTSLHQWGMYRCLLTVLNLSWWLSTAGITVKKLYVPYCLVTRHNLLTIVT